MNLVKWWKRRKARKEFLVSETFKWSTSGDRTYITGEQRAEYERLWAQVKPHGGRIPPVDKNAIKPLQTVVEVSENEESVQQRRA